MFCNLATARPSLFFFSFLFEVCTVSLPPFSLLNIDSARLASLFTGATFSTLSFHPLFSPFVTSDIVNVKEDFKETRR